VTYTITAGLDTLTDEELAALAGLGDTTATDALLHRYQGFVRMKARGYFLVGGDLEDLVQEGMIGLYKATRDFRSDRQSSFRAFAELCVVRQIITAIKTATRQKHQALNSYISIHVQNDSDDEESSEEILGFEVEDDPAHCLLYLEESLGVRQTLAALLSGLEVEVLDMYLEGRSYQEIALNLGRHTKSVDNALQRIKRKVEAHLEFAPSLAYAS
jgi:RNA polymerase sporulation-specific sigma factor